MKLSVVISTYNRAESLARTLESVKTLADEIIVVDNESTDATEKTAKRYKAKVFRRPNNPMLNINKNFGIAQATGNWTLYLDDDEVIPKELADEIRRILDIPKDADAPVGYWIPRKNIIFGKWIEHGIWWPDQQLRLFQTGLGKYPAKHVHEHIEMAGITGTLSIAYVHYNYDSIAQYLWKMESIYTDSEVAKLEATGYKTLWYDAIRFPVSDFVKLYFAQYGYKDGLHGLVLAILQAFYSFIVFAKIWERQKFVPVKITPHDIETELHRSRNEIAYWVLSEKILRANFAVKLLLKIKRKLYRV
jgi:glycosyltransferase involved in cell wall biosynthesis